MSFRAALNPAVSRPILVALVLVAAIAFARWALQPDARVAEGEWITITSPP